MSKNYTIDCSNVESFSYAKNFKLKVELTDTSIDKKANTSKIKYNVYAEKINKDGGEFSSKHLKYFKLNGSTIKNVTETVTMGDDDQKVTIASGTTAAISHNSDGTKTVKFTAKFGGQSGQTIGVKAAIEDEVYTLASIQRYFTEDPVIQKHSKTSSTYTFTWTTSQTCSKVVLYINGTTFTWTGSAKTGTIKATGLKPATEYDVYIKCTKEDTGTTMNSKTKQYTTFAKTTPTVKMASRTSSSITVSSGCNVDCKNVQYRIKKSGGSYGSWQTGTTFTGLSSNTAYVVQVYAENSESSEAGYGESTIYTYAATSPTVSVASKTSSSVTVKSSCNVTTSSIQYRIKKSGGSYGAYQTGTTFSNLEPYTTYTVEVKAVGSESGETGYHTVNVTTHQKTQVTMVLSSKTSSSITVSAACNVATSSAQYRIKPANGSYGAYQNSNVFTGLSPNTAYVVEYKAVGSASGESATVTVSATTYQKTIATIELESRTINSITVKSSCNVDVSRTQYIIRRQDGEWYEMGTWQTSPTFKNLDPNTTYVIQVEKIGAVSGEGDWKNLTVTTLDLGRITNYNNNWNVEEPITFDITNTGNSTLRLYLLYNGVEIMYRNNITPVNGKYTFALTTSEKNDLYTLAAGVTNPDFKFVLKSYSANTLVGSDSAKAVTIEFPTKAWTKINGTWKRALVWGRTSPTAAWRQCMPWVDVNKNKNWRRI